MGAGIVLAAISFVAQALVDVPDWRSWVITAIGLVALGMLAWGVFGRRA